MAADENSPFAHGSNWVRADFHLHTRADKEFKYDGDANAFVGAYVDALKKAGIGLAVITNHNKFDADEFKALRKRARREDIGLLPGVELSVNDGSNGVHTLVVFSDEWLADGNDLINQFLGTAFAGKPKAQYEQENGRSNDNLVETLKKLEKYDRDFFVLFAHVEANSGLWAELDGGRLTDLSNEPLIKKYCLGFQKVRTHDKGAKCRVKVQSWWRKYPAEVEGSDAKKLDEIGRGQQCFLKIGDYGFDAVKFALTDFQFRVGAKMPKITHSHVNAVRFEGGLLDGIRVPFSPHMNCLIGIQGSGKSSLLESLRFALGISFGDEAEDVDYKEELLDHVLKSGGKVIVEATDRHGEHYEVRRILGHQPDVYVGGVLRPGVAVRETVVCKPLYFGQKDLSAAGKRFGQDIVEKLVGSSLKPVREKIGGLISELEQAVDHLIAVQSDADTLAARQTELQNVKFRLEQFEKHGLKERLDKQVAFKADDVFCVNVNEIAEEWRDGLEAAIQTAEDSMADLEIPDSKPNADFFRKYDLKLTALKRSVADARSVLKTVEKAKNDLVAEHTALSKKADGLKEEFAKTEREISKLLSDSGVTAIKPDTYVKLTEQKKSLETQIVELRKKAAKESTRRDALLKLIAKLNDAWLEEYKIISVELNKINTTQAALKVQPAFKGDKAAFREKMTQIFKGHSIRSNVFEELASKYADFGAIFKDLENAAALTKAKAQAFTDEFRDSLFDLLSYQIPNSFEVAYHGKPLKSHSLGQRASAMMLFLLSQDDHDLLLIDQPEDDLDSQTVYEEVVKLVRDIKDGRQFILATHNANFPVLGDTEIVASCAYDDTISVTAGSIDTKESQTKIVGIMEGGKEAFERRKTIYEIWDAEDA
ncbi:TrlF family AAA-like ATPase [Bradyrhizobium yuanmingense]|uniref:TrlF family AAA-like ATPase n=1 Tax=Bradyrhizobium yuanmingense TaxID=108015 RepID=UPI0035182413